MLIYPPIQVNNKLPDYVLDGDGLKAFFHHSGWAIFVFARPPQARSMRKNHCC
jgi:hypothetical protein